MKAMNAINKICRFLTLILGIGALVLFFFPFTTLTVGGKPVDITAAQAAFGTSVSVAGKSISLYRSSYYLLTFILTAFATVMAGVAAFTKKGKGSRVASFVSALIAGVLMLVIACSKVTKYLDYRPLTPDTASGMSYATVALITAIVILLCAVIGIIAWLVNDYLEVLASGGRLTIRQKVVKFIREMISEIKKIVWPGPKTVFRNSVIVLVLCLLLGAFIWVVDFALGSLVNFISAL